MTPIAMLVPPGSDSIAQWASMRGMTYALHPDEAYFRRFEPYDTIAPPSAYLNSCTWVMNPGHAVVVEPWYAAEDAAPLERTILGFAVHPALTRRAAMRVGEHFLTRVVFLENLPPPKVAIGDDLWDSHVTTFASSPEHAAMAFHPRLRELLARWGFQGHIELRAGGGLVVFSAGLRPIPQHYDQMLGILRELTSTAIQYPR